MVEFQDRTVLIAGGAGVIGLATARAFLDRGARVMLVDADAAKLKEAVAGLASDRVRSTVADVTKADEVRRYAGETQAAFGDVHVFFNNAGIEGPVANITEYGDADFDRVMDVNVRGVFLGCKYVAPKMAEGGSIIITSSVAGMRGSPKVVGYTTSKWAVVGVMKSAAIDLAPRRIRCNSVHPGMVDSPMLSRLQVLYEGESPDGSFRKALIDRTPLKRYIKPGEVTNVVLFLASDLAVGITGAQYVVDAGFMT